MLRLQVPLPDDYTLASDDELVDPHRGRQGHARRSAPDPRPPLPARRGDPLGRPVGDSFKLAKFAADNDQATDIVFCGVHFMAESADVLTGDHQRVILPDLNAGCSMADMANIDQVEEAWDEIAGDHRDRPRRADHVHELVRRAEGVRRLATAARCARRRTRAPCSSGRSHAATRCCSSRTSTSAATPATRWATTKPTCACGTRATSSAGSRSATSRKRRSCCGRVTARCTSGSSPRTSRPRAPSIPASRSSCTPSARTTSSRWPTRSVRPSASRRGCRTPRPGTAMAIGTEIHMVQRLAAQHPDKTIVSLDPLDLPVLDDVPHRRPAPRVGAREPWSRGEVVNQIVVDDDTTEWARVALERMLAIT